MWSGSRMCSRGNQPPLCADRVHVCLGSKTGIPTMLPLAPSLAEPLLPSKKADQKPVPDSVRRCSKAEVILAPRVYIDMRNVMMASVRSAATPSPHVIATYSRRIVPFPRKLQAAASVANRSIVAPAASPQNRT